MDILQGIDSNQLGSLRVRQFKPGALVFREGDDAYGMYSVLDGEIEICKGLGPEAKRLSSMKRGEIFGEMALILDSNVRTATARAVSTSVVFEIPGNPVELARALPDPAILTRLLHNLIGVLSAKLRGSNENAPDSASGEQEDPFLQTFSGDQTDFRGPTAVIAEALPQEAWLFKRVGEGTELCREGENSDGFFFLHDGKVEILKSEGGGEKLVAKLRGPAMFGEAGCFAGEPRSATVRTAIPSSYTYFPKVYFDQICDQDPKQGAEILLAVARVLVHYITKPRRGAR